jgi:hypothetical protein
LHVDYILHSFFYQDSHLCTPVVEYFITELLCIPYGVQFKSHQTFNTIAKSTKKHTFLKFLVRKWIRGNFSWLNGASCCKDGFVDEISSMSQYEHYNTLTFYDFPYVFCRFHEIFPRFVLPNQQ